jgi:hypothetical protein
MKSETRTTDKKARVTLPRGFANATVIVEQVSDTEVRIRKAVVIPVDEVRLAEAIRPTLIERNREPLVERIEDTPEPTEGLRRAFAGYSERDGLTADG